MKCVDASFSPAGTVTPLQLILTATVLVRWWGRRYLRLFSRQRLTSSIPCLRPYLGTPVKHVTTPYHIKMPIGFHSSQLYGHLQFDHPSFSAARR